MSVVQLMPLTPRHDFTLLVLAYLGCAGRGRYMGVFQKSVTTLTVGTVAVYKL